MSVANIDWLVCSPHQYRDTEPNDLLIFRARSACDDSVYRSDVTVGMLPLERWMSFDVCKRNWPTKFFQNFGSDFVSSQSNNGILPAAKHFHSLAAACSSTFIFRVEMSSGLLRQRKTEKVACAREQFVFREFRLTSQWHMENGKVWKFFISFQTKETARLSWHSSLFKDTFCSNQSQNPSTQIGFLVQCDLREFRVTHISITFGSKEMCGCVGTNSLFNGHVNCF